MALKQNDSAVIIFGRYWITPTVIRMEILWSEPSWGPQPFPIYPPGFVVIATKNRFSLLRAYHGMQKDYSSPFGSRPPASQIAGTWDIGEMRFAWSEFLAADANDQNNLQSLSQLESQKSSETSNLVEQCAILDNKLVKLKEPFVPANKEIAYSYKTNEGRITLAQEKVSLPEYPIAASGLISSLKSSGGESNTNYGIRYHQQGRLSTIDWDMIHLDHDDALMPTHIKVDVLPPANAGKPETTLQSVYSPDGKLLTQRRVDSPTEYNAYSELGLKPIRRIALFGYKDINISTTNLLSETNFMYCTMSSARIQWYNDIQNRYWRMTMAESDTNRMLLNKLLTDMQSELSANASPPEQLRLLYVKIISTLILADGKSFPDLVDKYVVLLNDAGGKDIIPNCLLNLKKVCSEWPRENFAEIVQKKLDALNKD
jgi:hypothetical protein